jgi:hypothetical protein
MRLRPHEAALFALRENCDNTDIAIPYSRDSAIRFLEIFTSQNFGDDVSQWSDWLSRLSESELDRLYHQLEVYSKELPRKVKHLE